MIDMPSFSIETTADRVYRRFHNPNIEQEVKEWANEQLREIQLGLDQVLQFDEGFEDHLLAFIKTEIDRYHVDDVQGSPYESARKRPICTCEDLGCKLKNGRLPHAVVTADSMQQGIKAFKHEHRGTPLVLLDGAEAWSEKRAEVWSVLRHIETYLVEGQEERPDTAATDADGSEVTAD